MSTTSRSPSLPALREALRAEFGPKVRVARGHEGALNLRIISERFEAEGDPFELVQRVLSARGLELPEATLAVLRAPADLEEGEEELLLEPASIGTPTWADALTLEPESPPSPRASPCRTIAFWGLKGGVGRTTALAHVATILGRRQVVLALDLDLDSPGLVGTLAQEDRRNGRPRFDDLLRRAGDEQVSPEALQAEVKRALRRGKEASSRLFVLGPQHADAAFVTDLAGPLTPAALYRGRWPALRCFVEAAVKAAGADLLLLDARSGYADEAAMAVLDLADEVVVFASPSPSTYRSLEPALEALERSRLARGRPRLVHFAAGMLPGNEEVRGWIVSDLIGLCEMVQARVSEELATPVEERPPRVSPVLVDYTARIVENDGALLLDAVPGYRELTERIQPSPEGPGAAPVSPEWAARVVEEVCRFFEEHPLGTPETEDLLYLEPLSMRDFASASLQAIVGAGDSAGIGAGKSTLRRRMLRHPADYQRRFLEAPEPFAIDFINAYSGEQGDEQAALSTPLIERLRSDFVADAGDLKGAATVWKTLWSALLPWIVARGLHIEIPQSRLWPMLKRLLESSDDDDILAALPDLLSEPDALQGGLEVVRLQASSAQRSWVLLFDNIDLLFGRSPEAARHRQAALAGLISCDTDWARPFNPSSKGCLLFGREETVLSANLLASALKREELQLWTHEIHWTFIDSLRLIVSTTLVASPTFKDAAARFDVPVGRLNDGQIEPLRELLRLIWGERMDDLEGRLPVIDWLALRLRDGSAGYFPGPTLALLRHAFNARRRAGALQSIPLLDAGSLRSALSQSAHARLDELRHATTDDEQRAIEALRGLPNLEEPELLQQALSEAGAPRKALDRLIYLGVLDDAAFQERRRRFPTARVADLYALAPSLGVRRVHR